MKKILKTLDQLGVALAEHKHKWTTEERTNFEESVKALKACRNTKTLKITTEGLMNGLWQINISGIKDELLHDTEVAVLSLFGRKKNAEKK